MKGKTILAIVFILLACLFAGCHRGQTPAPPPDTRPCVANITVEGNFMSGRTIRTFQDFSNVTKEAAFNQIAQSLETGGLTIESANEETGVITSWKQIGFPKGETERLNVVVRDKGAAGIRVELTYISPAMATISAGALHYSFCRIMEDVQSVRVVEPPVEPKPPLEPPKRPPEEKQPPQPRPGPEIRTTQVTVPSENLREKPQGKIIGKVKKGTSLEILEEREKWLRVRLEDGTQGWIWKASTAEASKTSPAPSPTPTPSKKETPM